jgi:phosphoribosylformylglycinamidine cyclo-ligase
VLHFADESLHIVKDGLFDTPPLFSLIQQHSGTSWHEMYKVYNMGHRMEVYTTAAHAPSVIAAAERHGVMAQIIGRVEERKGAAPRLTIQGPVGIEQYN